MLLSFKAVAITLSLFGAASAFPLVSRNPTPPGSCRPDFDGVGLVVSNEANPTYTTQAPSYYFQFTGQPSNTYLIRPIASPDQVIAVTGTTAGSALTSTAINYNSADPLQLWNVLCDQCGTATGSSGTFTTGCSISLAASNLCLQLDASQANPLFLEPCTGGNDQRWDFGSS